MVIWITIVNCLVALIKPPHLQYVKSASCLRIMCRNVSFYWTPHKLISGVEESLNRDIRSRFSRTSWRWKCLSRWNGFSSSSPLFGRHLRSSSTKWMALSIWMKLGCLVGSSSFFMFPILSCLVSHCKTRPLRIKVCWVVYCMNRSDTVVIFIGRISEVVPTATVVCALGTPEGSWSFGNLGYTVSFPPLHWAFPESSSGLDRFLRLPVNQPHWWGTETAHCFSSYPEAPSTARRSLSWAVVPE